MIAAQRRNYILELLRADGAVSISALATKLNTSAVTVRRDLDFLDSSGLLTRTHGGALAGNASPESSYIEEASQAAREKQAISRLAATLVNDGDVVIVGPGTTTQALAGQLQSKSGLTVITNSLLVADAFVSSTGNEVIMTGGTLRAPIRALVGEATNRTLRGVHAGKTFLSGNGLVADFGLSTPNLMVADADRAMAAASEEVIVLADHTKFGVRMAIQTIPAESITRLVTDAGTPAEQIAALTASGVDVRVAHL